MNRRIWLMVLSAGLLAALLTACASNQDSASSETAATSTPAAPEAPAPGPTPAPAPEPTPPPTMAEVGPALPPEGVFANAQPALDALTSYRYSTLFAFVAEADGQAEAGSIELTGAVAGPDRLHLTWHDLGEDTRFEVIQIGEQAWILEEEGWQEVPVMVAQAMSQAVLVYAPAIAWGGAFGELETNASYVGQETVNGVAAYHYTTTYGQWGTYWPGQLESASGDVWLAEAGYPVKYTFTGTAVDEDGERGTVTWQMDVTDVNAPITIEAPAVSQPEY